MSKIYSFFLTLVFVVAVLFAPVQAQADQADFRAFVEQVAAEVEAQGMDPELFYRALGEIRLDEDAQESISNQPESVYSFQRYFGSMVSNTRINKGVELYGEHRETLERIANEYGVPADAIVAMWGVESFYGRWQGNHRVVRALTTLAYDSHRKEFFKRELMAAIKILSEGHISPEDMLGSWAGAMGQCQFMPTSFLAYAKDGNGDGKIDIWNAPADVMASAANYLKRHGWQTGKDWGERIVLTQNLPAIDMSSRGLSDEPKTIAQWREIGIVAVDGNLPSDDTKAWLFMPEGPSKRSYLVYKNFHVVMSWNYSSHFAFSALSLSDRIAQRQGS